MSREARIAAVTAVAILLTGLAAAYGWFVLGRNAPPGSAPAPGHANAVWPLTNRPAPDADSIRRRVVSVKIENAAAARPQSGLAEADVVYEVVAEGGITRFNALYHSNAPDRVGPVRSARPADIHIVRQYEALFAFSGANFVVLGLIDQSGIDDLPESAGGTAYTRSRQRRAPHNLYASIDGLRQAGDRRGYETQVDPPELEFGTPPSAETATATAVDVTFNSANRVVWSWDAEGKRYERELNGRPHADAGTQEAYRAANVVVLFADVSAGERPGTTDYRLDTSGEAIVFRDGKRYDGRWSASPAAPPRFTTASGESIPLATGPTWIEVMGTADRSKFE